MHLTNGVFWNLYVPFLKQSGITVVDSYERLCLRMILILIGSYHRMMESLTNCFSFLAIEDGELIPIPDVLTVFV